MRMDRLSAQAGESMVTTNTLASMDEDETSGGNALKRFNIILKVGPCPCPAPGVCSRMLQQGCTHKHAPGNPLVCCRRVQQGH